MYMNECAWVTKKKKVFLIDENNLKPQLNAPVKNTTKQLLAFNKTEKKNKTTHTNLISIFFYFSKQTVLEIFFLNFNLFLLLY